MARSRRTRRNYQRYLAAELSSFGSARNWIFECAPLVFLPGPSTCVASGSAQDDLFYEGLKLCRRKGSLLEYKTTKVLAFSRVAPHALRPRNSERLFGTFTAKLFLMNLSIVCHSRREFLIRSRTRMVTATIGAEIARELALTPLLAEAPEARLQFGALEPLVRLMQETPASKLLPILVDKLRSGTELKELVAAGALANARTFGGEDYVGFHTMMALAPGFHMRRPIPTEPATVPVLRCSIATQPLQGPAGAHRGARRSLTRALPPAE